MRFLKIIWIPLVMILWQIIYSLELLPPLVFPAFIDVCKGLYRDALSGELFLSLVYSLGVIFSAFIPSMIAALLMAALAFRFKVADFFFEKMAALFHPLPGVALLPLLIIWSGLGRHIIVLIVVHSVLWPFYISIRNGFRQIPEIWINVGRNNRLNRREELLFILLPGAFPGILAGIKIAWARSWRAVISAEMIYGTIGSSGGLGWFLFNKRIFMDSAGIYGGIIFLMIFGLLIESVIFKRVEEITDRRWGRVNVTN